MTPTLASVTCERKGYLHNSPAASFTCTLPGVLTLAERLLQERLLRAWKRPRVVQELKKHGVDVSAEAIRRYENGIDKPGDDVLKGFAALYERDEAYLRYGPQKPKGEHTSARLSVRETELALGFRDCAPEIQEVIELVVEVAKQRKKPKRKR